ncbi:hypothetical protein NECAME_11129 [Necator americanus]|uniref:Uncharacterized protein n=1 Tax=Necator americanus TaxID=51031 RepID=W2T5Q8_NECAM|nr:hypothetical protein NECAME_11129 [Necator americanus]ETN77345.1 hypothetical protein NECAME_11129 [Necator americanus]
MVTLLRTEFGIRHRVGFVSNKRRESLGEVFYKKPSPQEPKIKHYEKFKNKKQRISDGSGAERVEIHSRIPKGVKRRISNNGVENANESPVLKMSSKRTKLSDSNENVNVFADVLKAKNRNGEKAKKGKKRRLETEEGDDNGMCFELFRAVEIMKIKTWTDWKVKKVMVKRKKVVNGEIVEPEEDEDEESEDESGTDEDESDESEEVSDDSVVHVDDEESEGEAHIGEDREATVLQAMFLPQSCFEYLYTNGDSISFMPDFDKFPFTDEDSSVTATRAFAWMIAPCDVQTFFKLVIM